MKITSGIWLINSENKILLLHPTYHPSNFFSIPKGIVDDGEDYFSAAKRELFEETSIEWDNISDYITNVEELSLKKYIGNKKSLKSYIVKCSSTLDFLNIRCDSMVENHPLSPFPEVDGFIWSSLEDIISSEISLHHSHNMCFKEIYDFLKRN